MIERAPFDRLDSARLVHKTMAKGEHVFRQGDSTRFLVYVLSGSLHLTRHTASGEKIIVHRARAGETLAEAALFSDHYHCDGTAAEDAEVLLLPLALIKQALRDDPVFAQQFLARLAHQIVSLRARLELVAISSARERVFAAVVEGMHTGSIRELAAQIHLTPEATNRALGQLAKDGRLRKTGRGRYVA